MKGTDVTDCRHGPSVLLHAGPYDSETLTWPKSAERLTGELPTLRFLASKSTRKSWLLYKGMGNAPLQAMVYFFLQHMSGIQQDLKPCIRLECSCPCNEECISQMHPQTVVWVIIMILTPKLQLANCVLLNMNVYIYVYAWHSVARVQRGANH
jgi:hypothetical protein